MAKSNGWGGRREGAGRKPKVFTSAERPQSPKTESGEEPSNLTHRAKNGQFLPGNPLWKAFAFKKGHPGLRPNKFSPVEMAQEIAAYAQQRLDDEEPITVAGLRVWLGLSWDGLDKYARGEFGKTEEAKRAYVGIMDLFHGLREDKLEGKLERDRGNVNGIIHALNNQYAERWRSRVEHTGTQPLDVRIDLSRANELSPPIEPQAIQGEKHDVPQ